ncbi:hypothetical protein [Jiangella sp. DSM 45060]|uniref:hypothetical protein n=1 Tax=Jiangella sp. DSM 45060 TaxID=1798224 RepID=UPI00087A8680|nr:hypothetical protein [Jiangella sp. DSM 45060]SDT50050.1 hypothetical protein SAMN04515669_4396 [Jiangella sp. DSM 45060]
MNAPVSPPPRRRSPAAAAKPALLLTTAAGVVCAVTAAVASGSAALWSAVVAAVLVIAFFASGALPVLLARYLPASGMAGAGVLIVTYSLRLALIFIGLGVLTSVDGLDERALGLSLMVCALVYTLTYAVTMFRENNRGARPAVPSGGPE